MDRFLGRQPPPPARGKSARAKQSSKPAAPAAVLPVDHEGYALTPVLDGMLMSQEPSTRGRMAWPIAGTLGFGCVPVDRIDPADWLREHSIRLVVDVSGLPPRDMRDYIRHVAAANALLLHFPIDSRRKLQRGEHLTALSVVRTLNRALTAARRIGDREPRFAIFLCDSRGGGTAAMFAALLVALEFQCPLSDACVYTTRCWNLNLPESAPRQRMLPEGEMLKELACSMHAQLRTQPLTMMMSSSSAAADEQARRDEIFTLHNVSNCAKAVEAVLDLDVEPHRLATRPPFSRELPLSIVTWLRRNDPRPEPAVDNDDSDTRGRKRPDDLEDGELDEELYRGWEERKRRPWRFTFDPDEFGDH